MKSLSIIMIIALLGLSSAVKISGRESKEVVYPFGNPYKLSEELVRDREV